MLISPQLQRGLSLIELMVAVTLVSVLMMFAMPSFSGWIQNRQVRTAADAVHSGLQLARSEAIRRNRTVKFELTASRWQVGCDPVDTTIGTDGQQNCPAELQSRDSQESSPNAVITPTQTVAASGAAAASPVFTGSVTFTPMGRVAGAALPAGNLANFVVTNPTGGTCAASGGQIRCLSVVVSSAGQVRMCDPAVAASDSRAC
jgi:type IV fimbrial biogenesis protein FimT